MIGCQPQTLLGAHILRSSEYFTSVGKGDRINIGYHLGDTEINDSHLLVGVFAADHDIARFYISVDDSLLMSGSQSARHLYEDIEDGIEGLRSACFNSMGQRLAFGVVHDQKRLVFPEQPKIVYFNQSGMIQQARCPGL